MLRLDDVLDSRDAKLNFLKGCAMLATADGVVDEKEQAFFFNAAIGMNLPEEDLAVIGGWLNCEESPADIHFETKRQTLFFFKEALQLCYIDGDYADSEKATIAKLAELLGVSHKTIEIIERWVIDGIEWMKRGESLLGLEV